MVRNKKLKMLLILLAAMAISPPHLKLFDNHLQAQSDAYFQNMSPESRHGSAGYHFDDFSAPQGMGYNFGNFSGSGGNGFGFNDFSGSEGNGFVFGDFNGVADNTPIGNGLLLLSAGAAVWLMTKEKKRKKFNS